VWYRNIKNRRSLYIYIYIYIYDISSLRVNNAAHIGWVASWLPKIRSETPNIAPLYGVAVHRNSVLFCCSQTTMGAKWRRRYIGGSLYTHIFYSIFTASRTTFYSLSYKYLSVIVIKLKAEANNPTTINLFLYTLGNTVSTKVFFKVILPDADPSGLAV